MPCRVPRTTPRARTAGLYAGGVSENPAQSTLGAGPIRPRGVTVAAVLTGVQGAVVAALGLTMLVLLFTSEPDNVTQAVTGAATVLGLAVLPLAAGHGLWRLRRWSRGPAVIVQLLSLPVSWHLLGLGGLWTLVAALVAGVALAVLGCLVNPASTEALGVVPRGA